MSTKSVFDEAAAVWHMAGPEGLTIHGDVELGFALDGAERAASLLRGGDGRAACFNGGWICVGDDALRLTGHEMTLCLRMKDCSPSSSVPLLAKDDPNDVYGTILSVGGGALQ